MDGGESTPGDLLGRARGGDSEALGLLLEACREALRSAADRQLRGRLGGRLDASDLVQQSFLEASRCFNQFRGDDPAVFGAWLQQILERRVAAAVRDHALLAKRDVRRERPIDQDPDGTPALDLPGPLSTPSRKAIRREDAERLLRALGSLPDDQREAVRLRHLENWPLARIADHLGRSRDATAGLIKRGVQALRDRLADE